MTTPTGNDLAEMVVRLIEARLMYCGSSVRYEAWDSLLEEASAALEDHLTIGALRVVIQMLSDIAWDLADSWAREEGSPTAPLLVIRQGKARGW